MWLFDARGFVSVVAYDPSKDRNKTSKFTKIVMASPENKDKYTHTHLLVRARILEDLDMLKEVVPSLHVETDPAADYSFRCVVTRKQYKTFLAQAVDGIDYDSHFKEACRDRAPKSNGRYSALMSIWSTMASLQPYTAWGGSGSSYGVGYTSPYGSNHKAIGSKPKPSPAKPGFKDLDEFWDNTSDVDAMSAFRTGSGPRTGFVVGDSVAGYFGVGEVTAVSPTKSGADLLSIKHQKDGKTKTNNFMSNYVVPVALREGDTITADGPKWDLQKAYDFVLDHPDVSKFKVEKLTDLDDHAFEFVTRLQELEVAGDVPKAKINEVYEEILWASSSDEQKKSLAEDGAVPEKFVTEVSSLFSNE